LEKAPQVGLADGGGNLLASQLKFWIAGHEVFSVVVI
jgi:hypothetical protein